VGHQDARSRILRGAAAAVSAVVLAVVLGACHTVNPTTNCNEASADIQGYTLLVLSDADQVVWEGEQWYRCRGTFRRDSDGQPIGFRCYARRHFDHHVIWFSDSYCPS